MLPMVTARDFPMRLSQVLRCPGHCVHHDLGWWRFPVHWLYTTHQVSVNVKLTCIYWFTGLDILACEKLNPDVLLPYISPCCFERGVEWILLVPPLFQAYFCRIVGLCDTFIVSKWIWQVAMCCKCSERMVQIFEYVDLRQKCVEHSTNFLAFFMVLEISP